MFGTYDGSFPEMADWQQGKAVKIFQIYNIDLFIYLFFKRAIFKVAKIWLAADLELSLLSFTVIPGPWKWNAAIINY